MTVSAQMRGHPVYFDGTDWRYSDDQTLAPASGGVERPCTACGQIAEADYGPDPCLGWIEGSTGACCGHAEGHGDPGPDAGRLDMRRYAATELEERLGREAASLVLGHTTPAMTERYISTRDSLLRRAADELSEAIG